MGFYQLVPKGSSLYVVQGGGTGARMVVLLGHINHELNHHTDQGPRAYQDIKYFLYLYRYRKDKTERDYYHVSKNLKDMCHKIFNLLFLASFIFGSTLPGT